MSTLRVIACVAGAGLVAAGAGLAARTAGPSIQGNYVLDYRELPDGTKVRAPEVVGMLTLTKDRRNFNVYWTDHGKPTSISIISRYTLGEKEFTEENSYYMINDGAGDKGVTYETSTSSGKSPVMIKGDQITFKLPLHDEPECVFEKNGLTATRKGAFVDHWKKVD